MVILGICYSSRTAYELKIEIFHFALISSLMTQSDQTFAHAKTVQL